MGDYDHTYRQWREDPEGFWRAASTEIDWDRTPDAIFDRSMTSSPAWFPGGELNTCFDALDRHVRDGRGEQAALIYDSPVTGVVRRYSYWELLDEVARFAGALIREGVSRGDREVIYMPMVPEAVIAMLACARLGAIHSVVFGGFGADELAARIAHQEPGLSYARRAASRLPGSRRTSRWWTAHSSCSTDNRFAALCSSALKVRARFSRGGMSSGSLHGWGLACAMRNRRGNRRAVHPLHVGNHRPAEGIMRGNAGHAVALEWAMQAVYGVSPGEVYWAASDINRDVGHSYIVYAPLLHGCTTVLYESKPVGTPDAGAFRRVCADHRVSVMFTAPTAIRAIKREDPSAQHVGGHDLSAFGRCSWPESAAIRTRWPGPAGTSGCR